MKNEEHIPSEGEEFIEMYFEQNGYKYQREVKITNLPGDTKTYRVADWYLPNYGVFVEFYGQWNNSKESRERYREKKKIYMENNIPCIYIYPENLGVIDYLFPWRLEELLIKYKKRKPLILHQFKGLADDTIQVVLLMILTIFTILNSIEMALVVTSFFALVFYFSELYDRIRDAWHLVKEINRKT